MATRVSFRNASVFGKGFLSGPKATTAVTKEMCINGWIDLSDGSIQEIESFLPHLEENWISYLWSYIYYLYYMNRDEISEFRFMTDDVTKHASARNFYHVVRSVLNDFDQVVIFKDVTPLDKLQLATFILKILTKYKDRVKIPILATTRKLVRQLQMSSPSDIEVVLRTGEEQMAEAETKDTKKILESDVILTVKRVPVQEAGFTKRRSKRS